MTANQRGEPWSRDAVECRIYSTVEWGVRQARLSVDVILEIWGKERREGGEDSRWSIRAGVDELTEIAE